VEGWSWIWGTRFDAKPFARETLEAKGSGRLPLSSELESGSLLTEISLRRIGMFARCHGGFGLGIRQVAANRRESLHRDYRLGRAAGFAAERRGLVGVHFSSMWISSSCSSLA